MLGHCFCLNPSKDLHSCRIREDDFCTWIVTVTEVGITFSNLRKAAGDDRQEGTQTDERMNGRTDGRTNGRMHGRAEGRDTRGHADAETYRTFTCMHLSERLRRSDRPKLYRTDMQIADSR